jgi:hypothetical protein
MWLGREEEARIVFAKGVASGYWCVVGANSIQTCLKNILVRLA